jgi:hypothetical protein
MAGLYDDEQSALYPATVNPLFARQVQSQRAANPRPDVTDLFGYGPSWQSYWQNAQKNLAQNFPIDSPESVRGAAFNAAMNAGPLATVFHGSPHLFSKFDSSKVGTGEGAQAYGHGLYFAENKDVARGYKKSTSHQDVVRQFRSELPDDAGFDEVMSLVNAGQFSPNKANLLRELNNNDWLGFDYPSQAISQAFRQDLKNFDPSPKLQEAVRNYGNLYKVDLPDEHIGKMLDWDKPISADLRAKVIAALPENQRDLSGVVVGSNRSAAYRSLVRGESDMDGAQLYGLLEQNLGKQKATEVMRSVGIPGIKYLDAGSRDAGKGTSNYVVFDDQIPKIIGRE